MRGEGMGVAIERKTQKGAQLITYCYHGVLIAARYFRQQSFLFSFL